MATETHQVPMPHVKVLQAIPGLHDSDCFSDLTIKLGDRTWKAHKLVVCPQSKFFAMACSGEWKESQDSIVTLHEDSPAAIDSLLKFMYTGRSDISMTQLDGGASCTSLFAVADKYDMLHLAALAACWFTVKIETQWDQPGFLSAIRELYDECPDNAHSKKMREAVIVACLEHEAALNNEPHRVGFRSVIKDVPMFAIEFEKASLDNHRSIVHRTMELDRADHEVRMAVLLKDDKDKQSDMRAKHGAHYARQTMIMARDRKYQLEELMRDHTARFEKEEKLHKAGLEMMTFAQQNAKKEEQMDEMEQEQALPLGGEVRLHCAEKSCRTSFVVQQSAVDESLVCPSCGGGILTKY